MKRICSCENTWNANENICPHKDVYVKVHGSFIPIAKHWTPSKCAARGE